jgi:very-short-patch-repair endonuclease
MLGPIRLTSPARTLIDLAGRLDDEDLNAVVEDAIHRGLTTAPAIARRLDVLGGKGRPGSARLREILEDRGSRPAAASRLEVKIWRVLRSRGLTPVRQHPVRCGGTTYWLDCAFPQWRVAVEGFGDKFHRGARQRKRKLRRLADLATAQWRVLPVTWEEITDTPDAVVARIVTTLAA